MQQRLTTGQKIKYSYGAYNKFDDAPIAVAENVAEKINNLAVDKLI